MSKIETNKTPAAIAATINGRVLALTFGNGGELIADAERLTAAMWDACVMHGLKQKLVDAAAIPRNTETGRSATIDEKEAAVREVWNRLLAGEWNKVRDGEGSGNGGLLVTALIRLYAGRKTDAEIKAYVEGLNEKEQAAVRASSRVAPIIAAIKAERDAKKADKIDGEALLAGLDDAPL
jgi:frataxin-like iron-binding protein CyaY